MSPTQEEEKFVTVQIPRDILSELKWLVKETGLSAEEALREAIATEAYLLKHGSIRLNRSKISSHRPA